MENYVIIKKVGSQNGKVLPVIVLDGHGEVLEFSDAEKAEAMKDIFQNNSDSGHEYQVKKLR